MWLFGNWSSNTYKYYYCFGISLHFPMFSVISRALVPEETAGKGGIHTTEQQKKRLDQCSGSQRLFVIGKRNVPPLQQLTDLNDAGSICTALVVPESNSQRCPHPTSPIDPSLFKFLQTLNLPQICLIPPTNIFPPTCPIPRSSHLTRSWDHLHPSSLVLDLPLFVPYNITCHCQKIELLFYREASSQWSTFRSISKHCVWRFCNHSEASVQRPWCLLT